MSQCIFLPCPHLLRAYVRLLAQTRNPYLKLYWFYRTLLNLCHDLDFPSRLRSQSTQIQCCSYSSAILYSRRISFSSKHVVRTLVFPQRRFLFYGSKMLLFCGSLNLHVQYSLPKILRFHDDMLGLDHRKHQIAQTPNQDNKMRFLSLTE